MRRGTVLQGCLTLVAALMVMTTFAVYYAKFPWFHAIVLGFALVLTAALRRRADSGDQVVALRAVLAPAALCTLWAYSLHPDEEVFTFYSGLFYIGGVLAYLRWAYRRSREQSESQTGGTTS